jgi:hypothetical protein
MRKPPLEPTKLDAIVAEAQRNRAKRELGYREKALKMYPWVCGRCGREFTSATVHELTVHHRDHNHDNNPPDGSNWELLCLYCHDNEHARFLDGGSAGTTPSHSREEAATYRPFAELEKSLRQKK